ncbi:hypothetical protein DPMN_125103 [Dreissena polymorpha]|uniref:Uncharacterized protein n=1 Tax=Dreissena polymorpha TaxID=45954 RepID=A0A9D4GXM0_DREPO|nr:hypothetical protein DPMN_125103 [Dreissena polymorpha]
MPECRPNTAPDDMPDRSYTLETVQWHPKAVIDNDLMMYLRAARLVKASNTGQVFFCIRRK